MRNIRRERKPSIAGLILSVAPHKEEELSKKTKKLKEKYEALSKEYRKILKIVDHYAYYGESKEEAFDKILEVVYNSPS